MLKHVPQLHDFDRGDGVCKYLKNNLCSIYERRPLVCNTQKMYEAFFKDSMTPDEFIYMNLKACEKINAIFTNKV